MLAAFLLLELGPACALRGGNPRPAFGAHAMFTAARRSGCRGLGLSFAGAAAQAPAEFGHLGLDFLELLLVAHQSSFQSRTIELQSHELDYKFKNSLRATLLSKLCDISHREET